MGCARVSKSIATNPVVIRRAWVLATEGDFENMAKFHFRHNSGFNTIAPSAEKIINIHSI